MWGLVPPEERQPLYERAVGLIADASDSEGTFELTQEVRYTLATPA